MSSESLTVEETNALRAQMGLPPLRSAPAQQPPQPSSSPTPLEGDEDSAATLSHLRSELSRRKQARLASALLSAPSLSQQLSFQTGGAAAAWVERSRRVMEEEKAASERRRQAEAEQQRRQREEANQYGSAHLRGLRIAHQYDEFDADDQQPTVLVLKDKKIGEAGDDIDELINEQLDEKGRRQRLDKDNDRRKGRAWDDDMEDGPRLLSKYDGEEEKEGIVLGGGGVYDRDEEDKRRRRKEAEEREERLREGWGGAAAAVVTHEYDMSSTTERKIDSDYKQVKFKRKPNPATKPTKPTRTTTAATAASDDWINQLEQQALSTAAQAPSQPQTAAQADEERRERRVAGYLRAMEKGEEETRRRLERDREEEAEAERRRRAATQQEVEEEDEELAVALAKARRVTAKEREAQVVRVKVEGEEEGKPVIIGRQSEVKRLAEHIRSEREANGDHTVKREVRAEFNAAAASGDDAMQGVEQDDGSIVFTSVSNFASGLQAVDDEDRVKRERPNGVHKKEERADAALAEEKKPVKVKKEPARQPVQHDESERSGWIRYDDNNGQMDEGKEEADSGTVKDEDEDEEEDDEEEEEEEEEVLGDEPLASEGVAAALALAKRRAYLSSSSTSAAPTTFTLTQYDALGRELSAKEQFRSLSHAFHGQSAGWNKKDKRARRLRREVGVIRKRADRGLEEGAEKALEAQKRLGQAFIVLEGNKQAGFGAGGGAARGGGGGGGTNSVVGEAGNKRVKR